MSEKSTPLLAVLQLLRKYNLKGTEEILRKEASLGDAEYENFDLPEVELASILTSHHTESDPCSFEFSYDSLRKFIESSLDMYKYELSTLLYPVFVHMYMSLILYDHGEHAKNFLNKFGPDQEDYYQDDLKKLTFVSNKEQIKGNELAEIYSTNKFVVLLSRDSSSQLKRFLHEQKNSTIILNIINNHIQVEVHDGPGRSQAQVRSTSGGLLGEATKNENRTKVYYGLLKEPDIQVLAPPVEDEEETEETPDKPKKKKAKKDNLFMKKPKSDPNAPPNDRIPLPELKETDKIEKGKALREASKRVQLGPETLPSICFYTLLNSAHTATCADICDDSTMLAVGFNNSTIKVFALTCVKLRGMKSVDKLQDIDREAGDVLVRMMEERDRDTCRTLYGHSGPVFRVAFDPFKTMLLSCSEDSTVRLWSLQSWSCLVVYRGHVFPVWDVRWSQHAHYFATAGHDRTARLWATDQHHPLRIFTGHLSDVDCVQFHPNSNYIVTGSSDRTVRIWDCLTGSQVRIMTGHKCMVLSVAFSVCGRWVASAGGGGELLVWDVATGAPVAAPPPHLAPLHALAFSRDGTVLATENRTKVYYGLLKEPDIQVLAPPVEDEEETEETPDKPKKKKAKKDNLFMKKPKSDPNAPPNDRIPLPELKETDKIEKGKALREASKRVQLGPETLPSICFYTLLNSAHTATCADICDDSTMLAVGFNNSTIKVFALTCVKLRGMKSVDKLQDIDREAGDVLVRMMEERDRDTCRTLYGHSGPVFRVAFDPFKTMLLSCSEDSTVRLWSLQSWSCLVVYRGHVFPVWDVRWSQHAHYFATAGHDRTARLWATDQHHPLRIFTGHLSDVDCVQFHPNSNYIVTGSSDRTVRIWDCLTGSQVRIMTGHKCMVLSVAFSVCGRWVASAGGGGDLLVWDVATGAPVAAPPPHLAPLHALAFSRDGTVLATGSLDCTIKLWDFTAITDEAVNEDGANNAQKEEKFLLRSFPTKNSPITSLHFTRRNLLLAVGTYEGSL